MQAIYSFKNISLIQFVNPSLSQCFIQMLFFTKFIYEMKFKSSFCRFLGPAADEACQYVTGIMGKNPLLLRELDLSRRELGDTQVNQISALLQDKHCQLNTLK